MSYPRRPAMVYRLPDKGRPFVCDLCQGIQGTDPIKMEDSQPFIAFSLII